MKGKKIFLVTKANALFGLCLAFALFSAASRVAAQESDIEKIVKEISVDSQKGAIFSYSYLMKISYEKHKLGGRKFTRLYEAVLPSRFSLNRIFPHPLILLKDSEKPISDEVIRNTRKMIAKEIERAEKEEEKALKADEKPLQDGGYWTMGFSGGSQKIEVNIITLLKTSFISNLQRKQIDGRNFVLLDFAPNPAASFDKPLSYLEKIEGQIWIDEIDKRIVRIEGYPIGELAKNRDKTDDERGKAQVFMFEQAKVPEGFWFPRSVWFNFARHPEIFGDFEVAFTFSDYKKGSVDVQFNEDKPNENKSSTEKQ